MGVQRPAEHHYVRRRPPLEREADRCYYELQPSSVGLDEPAFAAVAPAIEAALLEAGCDYVEVDE